MPKQSSPWVVEKFIEKNRLPHLLFYGPPGTGKTSTILAVARRIYGADYRKQILEVRIASTLSMLRLYHALHPSTPYARLLHVS